MRASQAARVHASAWSRSTSTPYVSQDPSAIAETSRSESPSRRCSTCGNEGTGVGASASRSHDDAAGAPPEAGTARRTQRTVWELPGGDGARSDGGRGPVWRDVWDYDAPG